MGRALFAICLLKHKVTGAAPNLGHLGSSLPFSDREGWAWRGEAVKSPSATPPGRKNITSVSSAMELSEIHGAGDRINGETHTPLCSATEKFM